ncbi:hypothetical protein N9Z53_03575 [Mariniblastus sp.]|nr:hypothetical protein [Mariniblastus sp.]
MAELLADAGGDVLIPEMSLPCFGGALIRKGSGFFWSVCFGGKFRLAGGVIGSSGSLELLLGFENGRGAPLDAKRSGRIAAGAAFTNGKSLIPELAGDFFVAAWGFFCRASKVEESVLGGNAIGLND